ncbi:Panacea domain-containing protein [Thalassospira sp.]|uniref:Panacea domain-containing protein n=1 Tax=Thalassospira sp. TaxID=1912094 RepID=UPI0027353A1B|nr:hypothetical protein [Thalassospira sp.]MDP2698224.1 hypothetical protein [Thalassospira sp.]
MKQKPVLYSVFDAAFRLIDLALNDNEYLQPQKLHRLLYLAQAYHGATYHGRMLMPAVFVAEEAGPMEPNVYAVMEESRPDVRLRAIDEKTVHFIASIWSQFGHHSVDHLSQSVRNHQPYQEAFKAAPGTVISYASMVKFYAAVKKNATTAEAGEIVRPRVMRSHKGKPVATTDWLPRRIK